jgi:hypothetical protein
MKKKNYSYALLGVLILIITMLGCKKHNDQDPLALENTTWKLTREIWTFPNGNTEIFVKQSDLDGVFTWIFLNNQKVKILYEPYSFEESGQWSKAGDIVTIKVLTNTNDIGSIRDYKIIELTKSFIKLDVDLSNLFSSSVNGTPSKIYYELKKQ